MGDNASSRTPPGHHNVAALREGLTDVTRAMDRCRDETLAAELSRHLSTLQDHLTGLEEELKAQALEQDELKALYEVSQAIDSSLELTNVLNEVMDQIIYLTGAERSILMLVNPDTGHLQLEAARNVDRQTVDSSTFKISRSIVDQVAASGQVILTTNAQADPRFKARQSVVGYKLRSILCVPLKIRGRVTGVIYTDNRIRAGLFSDRDRDLLSAFASQAAVALENARLFDNLKTRNVENERLNEELIAANRELARLDQAKADFIDIASHELRTPLTHVRGYNDILGEMIEEDSLTIDVGRSVTHGIKQATQRLEEIVDTMLDVSQLEAEGLELSMSLTSIPVVVKAAADAWTKALEQREQSFTMEGLSDLPLIIADGERLRQVFSHLIQNAVKYTPDGGRIRVTGHLNNEDLPPHEQTIEVVVVDSGIGIADDELERIFNKFYRVGDVMLHSTGRIKFKGAGPGLGLAIARGIVKAHGGHIWAESPGYDEEICPGSAFHVVLPVQQPDART